MYFLQKNETTDISEKRIIHVYWVHVLINVACIGIPLILLTNLIVSQAFDKILLRELLKWYSISTET